VTKNDPRETHRRAALLPPSVSPGWMRMSPPLHTWTNETTTNISQSRRGLTDILSRGRPRTILVLAGCFTLLSLVATIVLFRNLPSGYGNVYGFALPCYDLFAELWQYPTFEISQSAFSLAWSLLMLLQWGMYAWAAVALRTAPHPADKRRYRHIIVTVAVAATLLMTFVMPPALSTDIYRYAMFGRAMAFDRVNPYDTVLTHADDLPYTAYTPWLLVSSLLARVVPNSVLGTILTFKVFAATCHLANGAFVYLIAERLRQGAGTRALLLYAWNPLLVLEFCGSGHNDALMVTLALAGLYLAVSGRRIPALLLLIASALVKYLTGLLLALVVLHIIRQESSGRRWHLLFRMGIVGALTIALLYTPLLVTASHATRVIPAGQTLQNEAKNLFQCLATSALETMLDDVLHLETDAGAILTATLYVGFVALLGVLIVRLLKQNPEWRTVISYATLLSGVYVVFVYGGLWPWYLTTPLAVTSLTARPNQQSRLLVYANFVAALYMLPYGWLVGC